MCTESTDALDYFKHVKSYIVILTVQKVHLIHSKKKKENSLKNKHASTWNDSFCNKNNVRPFCHNQDVTHIWKFQKRGHTIGLTSEM